VKNFCAPVVPTRGRAAVTFTINIPSTRGGGSFAGNNSVEIGVWVAPAAADATPSEPVVCSLIHQLFKGQWMAEAHRQGGFGEPHIRIYARDGRPLCCGHSGDDRRKPGMQGQRRFSHPLQDSREHEAGGGKKTSEGKIGGQAYVLCFLPTWRVEGPDAGGPVSRQCGPAYANGALAEHATVFSGENQNRV